jgi:hypothetical protein
VAAYVEGAAVQEIRAAPGRAGYAGRLSRNRGRAARQHLPCLIRVLWRACQDHTAFAAPALRPSRPQPHLWVIARVGLGGDS